MPLVANWLAKYKTRVEGMLGGIDYYPKRKKRIKFKIFLLFSAVGLSYLGWAYVASLEFESKPQSTSIVISAPESEEETIQIVVESSQETTVEKVEAPDNNENLDEVIENYEASSYN